jgi:transposase-like protein
MIAPARDEDRGLFLESRRSLVVSDIEIIRTERRRRYSDAEKAALLAEVDRGGCTVAEVARRHGVAESLLYNWRSHRRASASLASEPLQFISYGEVTNAVVDISTVATSPAVVSAPPPPVARRVRSEQPATDELIRPHPGSRPGAIDIELGTGVRLSVDSDVNEKALARVLRALQDVPCSR